MRHPFEGNLHELIDLVAKQLCGEPKTFFRELLRNAHEAITQRQAVDANHSGQIEVELLASRDGRPIICFADNGAGFTHEDLHPLLATPGTDCKRYNTIEPIAGTVGQLGFGLLSALIVSDEVVFVSRSIGQGAQAIQWHGRADGTYSVSTLLGDLPFGTAVYLIAKDKYRDYFVWPRVRYFLEYYGALLPHAVWLVAGSRRERVDWQGPPWRRWNPATAEGRRELLRFATKTFNMRYLDVLPLRANAGKVEGVAFVLAAAVNQTARPKHRVYLPDMLLSEELGNMLPEWAEFVTAIVHVADLHPTTWSESAGGDRKLPQASPQLGLCLQHALVELAEQEPERFDPIVRTHPLTIRALSARDETCFRAFADWIRFETSRGLMSVRQMRASGRVLTYVEQAGDFEYALPLARANDLLLVNASGEYEVELLVRLPDVFKGLTVRKLNVTDLVDRFSPVPVDEMPLAQQLVVAAHELLMPFRCDVQVWKFSPHHVPAVYLLPGAYRRLATWNQRIPAVEPLYAGTPEKAPQVGDASSWSVWCVNWSNAAVRSIALWPCRASQRKLLGLLYAHSLLQAGLALGEEECRLLSEGLASVAATLCKLPADTSRAQN